MPLPKPLEDLLKQVQDENDRKALQANFEKYNFFVDKFSDGLRQSDYDSRMNQVKTEREKEQELVAGYQATSKKWGDWAATNVPKHDDLVKKYGELETKVKTLEEEKDLAVAAAAAKAGEGGTPVDAKELARNVDEIIARRGYVSQSEMQKIVAEQTEKQVSDAGQKYRENFYKQDLPGMMSYLLSMNNLQFQHMNEFKSGLDTKAFAKFMADNKIDSPDEAYKQFTSEARDKMRTEQLTEKIRADVEKEFASKFNLPGSGASPMPELGVVQARQLGKTPNIPENAEAGDNRLAYAAAAELRSEGRW